MMIDATERTRGILEYVNTLENKIRRLQNEIRRFQNADRRFQLSIFLFGFAAGGAVMLLVALRYLR